VSAARQILRGFARAYAESRRAAPLADFEKLADALSTAGSASEAASVLKSLAESGNRAAAWLIASAAEASAELQAKSPGWPAILKYDRAALLTCPGRDVCAISCYAIHGRYATAENRAAMALYTASLDLLLDAASAKYGAAEGARVAGLGLAGAFYLRTRGRPAIIRLHSSGDINSPQYLAALIWLARYLPGWRIYTYTKSFQRVLGDPAELYERGGATAVREALRLDTSIFRRGLEIAGGEWPENLAVNVSGTVANTHLLASAVEELSRLGVKVPTVFFYLDVSAFKQIKQRRELYERLVGELLDTGLAVSRVGGSLVLEPEHGVSAARSRESAALLEELIGDLIKEAERRGVKILLTRRLPGEGFAERTEEIGGDGRGGVVKIFVELGGEAKRCAECLRCVVPGGEERRGEVRGGDWARSAVRISIRGASSARQIYGEAFRRAVEAFKRREPPEAPAEKKIERRRRKAAVPQAT
jgi:hypothetical protein